MHLSLAAMPAHANAQLRSSDFNSAVWERSLHPIPCQRASVKRGLRNGEEFSAGCVATSQVSGTEKVDWRKDRDVPDKRAAAS
jgi:hypothetical protein